jgi:hypothetical protein
VNTGGDDTSIFNDLSWGLPYQKYNGAHLGTSAPYTCKRNLVIKKGQKIWNFFRIKDDQIMYLHKKIYLGMTLALYTSTIHAIFVINLFVLALKSMGIISWPNVFIRVQNLSYLISKKIQNFLTYFGITNFFGMYSVRWHPRAKNHYLLLYHHT